jgi:hypothetical protein
MTTILGWLLFWLALGVVVAAGFYLWGKAEDWE